MVNLKKVADAMFNKTDWATISDTEKKDSFFIFNRFFSKKYPEKSELLNLKKCDSVSSMNIWHYFFKNKSYPIWFWSKPKKENINKIKILNSDIELLRINFNISEEDVYYLFENYNELVKEELKYLKSIEKIKK